MHLTYASLVKEFHKFLIDHKLLPCWAGSPILLRHSRFRNHNTSYERHVHEVIVFAAGSAHVGYPLSAEICVPCSLMIESTHDYHSLTQLWGEPQAIHNCIASFSSLYTCILCTHFRDNTHRCICTYMELLSVMSSVTSFLY